jgi:hypothetical protein
LEWAGEVAERQDSDQALFAVEHWQAPYLLRAHVVGDVLDVLVVEAVQDLLAHHVAHGRVGREVARHAAYRDVAVGDHPHEAIVLAHGKRSRVALGHHAGGLADRLVGSCEDNVNGHHVFDFHVCSFAVRCGSIATAAGASLAPARGLDAAVGQSLPSR